MAVPAPETRIPECFAADTTGALTHLGASSRSGKRPHALSRAILCPGHDTVSRTEAMR